ncbi:transposase [Caballeronia sp. LjRoot29]
MCGSEARVVKRGRPQVYSDAMIQAVLTLKHVYHLTLRGLRILCKVFVNSHLRTCCAQLYDTKPPGTGTTGDVAQDVERRPSSSGCR